MPHLSGCWTDLTTSVPLIHPSSRQVSLLSKETDGRPSTAVAVDVTACVVLLNVSLLGSTRAHALAAAASFRSESLQCDNRCLPNLSHARNHFAQGPCQQNTRPLSPATVRSGGPHQQHKTISELAIESAIISRPQHRPRSYSLSVLPLASRFCLCQRVCKGLLAAPACSRSCRELVRRARYDAG